MDNYNFINDLFDKINEENNKITPAKLSLYDFSILL